MSLPVIHLDRGQQAAFTGWKGEVSVYADLPAANTVPGEFWMVLNPSGSRFLLNYKASGLYLSETGSWRKINDAQILLNDNQFAVYNAIDNTKQIAFDVADIATGTKRTATWQDSNGVVAYNSNIVFTPTINSSNWVEVSQESDFGTAVAGTITLAANTIYFVRGEITINSNLVCNVEGVEIVGTDRNTDHLIWNGSGALLTIADVNFGINQVRFSSNNVNTSILDATNINAGSFNAGRLKVLTIFNCQFRGTYDVIDIKGFDLVDINNCLFFYIKATNFGLRFEDTSKIQLSSCELIRWFDETTIPTPGGWSTVSMIELKANNIASFGAVNINGCIVHPQQTQNGIDINTASTTGFGTISSNAFINLGLTTGKVFLPEIPVILLPDYSQTATLNYDIFSNQGLLNSTSGTVMTLTGNTTNTVLTAGVPTVINTGGNALQQAGVRFTVTTGGRSTYIGNKQKFVSIHASIAYQKQGGGSADYVFYIYKNGVLLAGSNVDVIAGTATSDGTAAINYGVLMELNDYLEIYVENPANNDDILIKDLQLVIRE
ncbi:MAG: hypothetical protein OEM04_01005 [Flavobacteriaceae bacterium]|nr:hypothetical protein [Flavobacteriaceae bacterium]